MLRLFIQLLVLISLATFLSLQIVVPFINEKVGRQMLSTVTRQTQSGMLHLLAERLNAVSGSARIEALERAQEAFGVPVLLQNIDQLSLTEAQRQQLLAGDILVQEPWLGRLALADKTQVLGIRLDVDSEFNSFESIRVSKGNFWLLQERFQTTAERAWPQLLEVLNAQHGFQVSLKPLQADLGLNAVQQQRLRQGEIVGQQTPSSKEYGYPADVYYQRLKGHDQAIALGPVTEGVEPMYLRVLTALLAVVSMFIVLPLVIWLWPSFRSAVHLRRATRQLGLGDFRYRAACVRGSHLNEVTKGFNDMAEQVQGLFRSQKMLTHAVSHDLRTPLARIEFALDLLRHSQDQQQQHKQLQRIEGAVEELDHLVNEMLAYAQYDRERPLWRPDKVDLRELMQELLEEWQALRPELEWTLDALDATVLADLYYLRRAFNNILANAAQYARTGVQVFLEKGAQNEWRVRIEEDGPGIAVAHRAQVFEPFFRVDASRNRASGGTGLGLAIARQVVRWHNGHIRIEAAQAGGASLQISLPSGL